jgi:hypothetical protein
MAHPVAEGEGRGRGLVWGEIPGGEVGGGICGRLPSSHGRGRARARGWERKEDARGRAEAGLVGARARGRDARKERAGGGGM